MNQASSKAPKTAVIGAGVVGLCTALQFIRAGHRVSLFDPEPPAKQTSFGNAAYLAAEYSEPLASPHNIYDALALTLSERAAFKVTPDHLPGFIPWALRFLYAARPAQMQRSRAGLRCLNLQAIDSWKDVLRDAGVPQMMINSGFMKLWETPSGLAAAHSMQSKSQQAGFETELIVGPQLYEREPALSTNIHHALLFPGAMQLSDPYLTCMALFEHFQNSGGHFSQQAVRTVRPDKTSAIILSDTGAETFDYAVVAAGAWSKALLKSMQLSVPLAAERGYHLTLPDAAFRPRHILESVERHVVLSSLKSGLRIVGFGEYGRLNSKQNPRRHKQLGQHLQALIKSTDLKQDSISHWMGNRPTLPDSLPVIDLHPEYSRVGFVFGHHHLGVTQAAVSARIIRSMMIEGKNSPALEPFKPSLQDFSVDRFGRV